MSTDASGRWDAWNQPKTRETDARRTYVQVHLYATSCTVTRNKGDTGKYIVAVLLYILFAT